MNTSLFLEFEDAALIDFPYKDERIRILCKPSDHDKVLKVLDCFIEKQMNEERRSAVFSASKMNDANE